MSSWNTTVLGLLLSFQEVKCQGGVTPIDSIVTAVTALVNLYTKEGVELPRILTYTSVNVHIVNGGNSTQSTVKAPNISVVNGQNAEKSWSKLLLVVATMTIRSDIPLNASWLKCVLVLVDMISMDHRLNVESRHPFQVTCVDSCS